MQQISKATSAQMLKGSNGQFVSVRFTKKDGTERLLNGRTGVHNAKNAPLTGQGMAYKPADYGLMGIFDSQIQEYRMVNLDTISELTVGGQTYQVS